MQARARGTMKDFEALHFNLDKLIGAQAYKMTSDRNRSDVLTALIEGWPLRRRLLHHATSPGIEYSKAGENSAAPRSPA
eukprot:6188313-Pleurochrysis_carterae.AAC.2